MKNRVAKFWSVLYSHAMRAISVPAELDEKTRKTLFMYLGRSRIFVSFFLFKECSLNSFYLRIVELLQRQKIITQSTTVAVQKEWHRPTFERIFLNASAQQGSDFAESVSTSTLRLNIVGAFGDPERDSVITHLRLAWFIEQLLTSTLSPIVTSYSIKAWKFNTNMIA